MQLELENILASAAEHQVELWFEGERLRFRAPSGGLPADLRANLSEHKADLVQALREQAAQNVAEYPLTHSQQGLWFLNQSDPASAAYHVAFTGRITSPIDVGIFKNALQAVSDRHSALRTTFPTRAGVPVQHVRGYAPVCFEHINAAGWDEETCYAQVSQAYSRPFDLENGPLLRAHLFSCGERDHILLINVHHIVMDGWSVWIMLDELRSFYAANAGGPAAAIPRPPVQFSELVKWQENILTSQEGEAQWKYWHEQLAGELPVLNLPTDRPRPSFQSTNGSSINFIIPVQLTEQLKALAKTQGATLYMVLFTAYQVLLHRYTGQEDILTGVPTFGRGKAEFAKVIGDFVNMLALRVDSSGDPTFLEFLERMRKLILNGLEHQDLPFPLLVARLGGQRDTSRSAVFQATFDVQRLPSDGDLSDLFIPGKTDVVVDFGGLTLLPYPIPQQEGQFDLSILMMDADEVIAGTLKFNSDIFDETTAQRMVEHFLHLLERIMDNPAGSISSFALLTPAERQRILVEWNQTGIEYPRDILVHQLFEAQVEQTADDVAVVFEDQCLTYRELNAKANQVAHALRNLGVGPNQLVGIFVERSLEMVIALLGVMKSGAAYVPMDPIFPAQRILMMIEDSQMPMLITQGSLVDSLPQHNARLVLVDEKAAFSRQPVSNPNPVGGPESLAYVIFTSGSTGRPKGVQIAHRALVNFLTALQREPGIHPSDILASVTTLSFDIAGLELYLPLISGARLVVLSADITTDGFALADALESCGATILQATPATWRLLVETGWPGRSGLKMLCGGEALPLALGRQLMGKGAELWNMYGPTETTIWSTASRIQPTDDVITIGRPIANTHIFILDAHLQPVPPGVTGALYIGGEGLAQGYLNRPDLNAEKFIPSPYEPGARIYHTGDLARYLPDGRIVCLGRSDTQVKLRGFRIELGEIEAVLSQHPAVTQAVVALREDTPGDRRLVAYYTADTAPTARELSKFLREKLPAYMIPSAFIVLDAFPKTPNGKVDRRALPAPSQGSVETYKAKQPPTTPTEMLLGEVWRKCLNVDQINIFDNFFDLGGHSLLAMQVIAEIQQKTGTRIEPAYLRIETLAQLAARLDASPNSLQG